MAKIEKNPSLQNTSTVYGPVASRRLGKSLGIDPLFQTSICSFNCTYCQLGDIQKKTSQIDIYVSTETVISDLKAVLKNSNKIDYITFSGSGEPTLAENLGDISRQIKKILPEAPQAILTNATTLHIPKVAKNLFNLQKVIIKIDACNEKEFQLVNRPVEETTTLKSVLKGIKSFQAQYKGIIEVQMMYLPSNLKDIEELARILIEVGPSTVQVNGPKRPYPLSWHRENRGNHQEIFDYKVQKLKMMEQEKTDTLVKRLKEMTNLNFIIVK